MAPSECEEIFKFYHLNLSLKDKMRTGWDSNHWNVKSNRLETISEHVIGTFSLALVANCEFEYPFDFDKILKMVLIHEIGETLIGDITSFDGIMQEKKKEIEQQAMKRALGNLRQKDNLLALLYEFDERKTKEATFSYYCDKMEADLEAKLAHEKGLFVSLENRKNNRVLNNPKIQRLIKDGLKNVIDIFFQWDRPIYETADDMQEFSEMLKISQNDRLSQENVETEG